MDRQLCAACVAGLLLGFYLNQVVRVFKTFRSYLTCLMRPSILLLAVRCLFFFSVGLWFLKCEDLDMREIES